MCGIAGFIGFSNNFDLAKMANDIQKHRGPDNQGVWNDKHISLAHQRLAIIDLHSRSNQPFEKHNLIIVFNGEIYNYQELKISLIKEKSSSFITSSDTEVVLEMFYHYKERCLDKLEGMFAFAIYNKVSRELFLARDHFGIKPLFYSFINNGFAFSSELKTLVSIPGFNKDINFKALISSLNYLWVSGHETMFKCCSKLPPAHFMILDGDLKLKIQRYWDISGEVINKSEKEYIEGLSDTLERSIAKHMIADVPVATFLSGGLDSSFISVVASRYNSDLLTYTIGTVEKDKKIEKMPDDARYARMLAKRFGFNYREIIINSDIVRLLPKMVRTLDEPVGDPAALNTWLICENARNEGTKVLLSGMGADEIFAGYRRHKAILLAQRYKKYPHLLRSIIKNLVDSLPVKIGNKGLRTVRWAKRFLDFASLPTQQAYMRSYSYYSRKELSELFLGEHARQIQSIYDEHEQIFHEKYKGDIINQMCFTDINMFMLGLNLTYTDRASMAKSVEVRVPFIDRKVVCYAMSIPGNLKIRDNETKYIFKKVAERYLPREIIYRPKASFGAPIRSWISHELSSMVDDLLSEQHIKARGIFNIKAIEKIINNDRSGLQDNAYQLYQLLTIELWFREFIDN